MNAVGLSHPLRFEQPLQLLLDFGDGVCIEQLAQIGITQQVAKLVLVDGQRLRPALGQRRVSVIYVIRDIAEQQRRGERRRHSRPAAADW